VRKHKKTGENGPGSGCKTFFTIVIWITSKPDGVWDDTHALTKGFVRTKGK
jgi:hypothetical protein